jgi:hypothetical protein
MREHEILYAQWQAAHQNYKDLEEHILSGEFIKEMWTNPAVQTPEDAQEHFLGEMESFKRAQEELNIKTLELRNAMRQLVVLAPTQWRGWDGDPSVETMGTFRVRSTTHREFDVKELLRLARKYDEGRGLVGRGLEQELLSLTYPDEKTGQAKPALEPVWKQKYSVIKDYLLSKGLEILVKGSYEERDGTPQVFGPKKIHWLGDAYESKEGTPSEE